MTVGMSNLRAYRKAHNLTQAEAAAKLGCSQEMVARIEDGTREPSADLAARLERLLTSSSRGSSSRGPYLMGRKRTP